MLGGTIASCIHGMFPFLFKTAATSTKDALIKKLSNKRKHLQYDIKLLLLDVDGTLTSSLVSYPDMSVAFSTKDGHGIRLLMREGVKVGIITGRQQTDAVAIRCDDLDITLRKWGYHDKKQALLEIIEETGIPKEQIAFMGDDTSDAAVMGMVGLSFAPLDAHPSALEAAKIVTENFGGDGAVREATDILCSLIS